MASLRDVPVDALLDRYQTRAEQVSQFVDSYRRYCWEVNSLADLRLAPFHLLATESATHADKSHRWHMETLAKLRGGVVYPTAYQYVDVTDAESIAAGIAWWEELTGRGGEGMIRQAAGFHRHRRARVASASRESAWA